MKALTIYETLNFKRGIEPSVAMQTSDRQKVILSIDWTLDYQGTLFLWNVLDFFNYKHFPILVLKRRDGDSWSTLATSIDGILSGYSSDADMAIEEVKMKIDRKLAQNESLQFKRGLEPVDAMGTGDHEARIKKQMYDKFKDLIYALLGESYVHDIEYLENKPTIKFIFRMYGITYYVLYSEDWENEGPYFVGKEFKDSSFDKEMGYDDLDDAIGKLQFYIEEDL